jgi:hypothetical protein
MRRHNQAQRMIALPPYPFARWNKEIARVRAEGVDVIRLDIGNPDLPPPDSERFQLVEGPRFLGNETLRYAQGDIPVGIWLYLPSRIQVYN